MATKKSRVNGSPLVQITSTGENDETGFTGKEFRRGFAKGGACAPKMAKGGSAKPVSKDALKMAMKKDKVQDKAMINKAIKKAVPAMKSKRSTPVKKGR